MASGEHKVTTFAYDVLVFLEEPENLFIELMTLLSDFRKLSSHKLNISKTQVMALNHSAPEVSQLK